MMQDVITLLEKIPFSSGEEMGPSTQMEVLTLEISTDSHPSLITKGSEKKGREWLGMPTKVNGCIHLGSLEEFFLSVSIFFMK